PGTPAAPPTQPPGPGRPTPSRPPPTPPTNTAAPAVQAATLRLPAAVGTSLAHGHYLNPATAREPVAVLGAAAAQRLGVDRIWPGERIWLGSQWVYLAGILRPTVLDSSIDSSVLVGFPAARRYLHFDGHPSTIYLRPVTDPVTTVPNQLAAPPT